MNSIMKTVALSAMVMGAGFGTMASADPVTMTCGEFMIKDDAAQAESAHALMVWIADTANFEQVGPLVGYKMVAPDTADAGTSTDGDTNPDDTDKGYTDAEMVIIIEAHCADHSADTNIMMRLKEAI
jgi:hypothetical protein